MHDFQKIIDEYLSWIKDNTSLKEINDGKYGEITTPFLDRHNDHIQIYAQRKGDIFILTDDGQTIADLNLGGLELTSTKRQKIFRTVLNGFGVSVGQNNDLFVEGGVHNIGQKKHHLLQAILAVNDMYVLSTENIASFFKEDVERFFSSNQIFYTKDIKITGKSGFDHNIDFAISASNTKPERLIKALNYPRKDPIMSSIFAFADISVARGDKSKNYVIYNDLETAISADAKAALSNYGIVGIPWSQRDESKEQFTLV